MMKTEESIKNVCMLIEEETARIENKLDMDRDEIKDYISEYINN